ncbi:hypothetical protein [Paenibacillus yonginensis]|uniref:hypothetical protein n=1 Tax=Paenibacillus yonginensis TaxID=1462996 RepID=UPI00147258B2|nr:hypothetical protein [Paenibacillus yonginensis]
MSIARRSGPPIVFPDGKLRQKRAKIPAKKGIQRIVPLHSKGKLTKDQVLFSPLPKRLSSREKAEKFMKKTKICNLSLSDYNTIDLITLFALKE